MCTDQTLVLPSPSLLKPLFLSIEICSHRNKIPLYTNMNSGCTEVKRQMFNLVTPLSSDGITGTNSCTVSVSL